MASRKKRVTVTIDADLVRAASEAVRRGEAGSVSSWVNAALRDSAERGRRRAALAEVISAYEAEHGVITDAEMAAQWRADREAAVVVRGGRVSRPKRERKRRPAA